MRLYDVYDVKQFNSASNCISTYLIASVEALMLLVNLQLATTSTVDGFQPVIEVAVTKIKIFFL